jgi:MYXO-CTERM domain-containing protein
MSIAARERLGKLGSRQTAIGLFDDTTCLEENLMNRLTLTAAGLASVAVAGAASAEIMSFDIAGDYNAAGYSFVSGVVDGGGGTIISYGFSVDVTVYWNEGSSYENWASECRLGVGLFNYGGSPGYVWTGGITSAAGASTVGGSYTVSGITGSSYIASYGFAASASFGFMAYSSWNDGTGLAAGTLSGTGWINVEAVPAPGAIALLGLAGLAGRRRRR